MVVSIYINAQIDSDACWVPVDGKAGLEEDMKELVSSAVSDTTSNSIRVIKVYKQANSNNLSYLQCAREVIKADGIVGLFGRGLKTKLLSNGLQGIMFSVLWKYFEQVFNQN